MTDKQIITKSQMIMRIAELSANLAAKEQECERLKKKLNPKLKNAHCTYFEGQTGLCKAKEFTKCNPVNCKIYTIDELSTIVELQQQLDQLKAENEDLKKSILQECPNCGEEYLNHKGAELYCENNDLKQTLAEIKEIAKYELNNLTESAINGGRYVEILQKINECEGNDDR